MTDRLRLLLVDDDDVDRMLLKKKLVGRYDILEAATGYAGVHRAEVDRPDCVLLDHRLPDGRGLDLVETFTDLGIDVILLTGLLDRTIEMLAEEAGVRACYPKDRLSGLGATLEEIATERRSD